MEQDKNTGTPEQPVTFVCERHPELTITITPFGLKDAVGNRIKAQHALFRPSPKYGMGAFDALDKKTAMFLKEHEYYKTGIISLAPDLDDIGEIPVSRDKVKTGTADSEDTRKDPEPETQARNVKAAKTPAKKGIFSR